MRGSRARACAAVVQWQAHGAKALVMKFHMLVAASSARAACRIPDIAVPPHHRRCQLLLPCSRRQGVTSVDLVAFNSRGRRSAAASAFLAAATAHTLTSQMNFTSGQHVLHFIVSPPGRGPSVVLYIAHPSSPDITRRPHSSQVVLHMVPFFAGRGGFVLYGPAARKR